MAESKLGQRLATLVKRYDTGPALFGTQIKKAVEIIKQVSNGKGKQPDESSAPH